MQKAPFIMQIYVMSNTLVAAMASIVILHVLHRPFSPL